VAFVSVGKHQSILSIYVISFVSVGKYQSILSNHVSQCYGNYHVSNKVKA
jgi:hypothetical protein